MIILYDTKELEFKTLGIGVLRDAIKVSVTEELNGLFELTMEYPIDGHLFNELKFTRIICCKSSPYSKPQPFRIYSISTPINRTVTINAAHISYDLSGFIVDPFSATNLDETIAGLKNKVYGDCPFEYVHTVNESGNVNVSEPKSVRSVLGEHVSKAYQPDFTFDGLTIIMEDKRGSETGVNVVYGKNLIDINQEENNTNVYTGVYPYWRDEEDNITVLEERVIKTPGTWNYTKIYPLDLSNEFKNKPTQEEMKAFTEIYIEVYSLGIPEISLSISVLQLNGTNYEREMLAGKINLGDTITVQFPDAKVNAKARCIKTVYDPLQNRYETLELGDAVRTLADSIISTSQDIDDKINAAKESTKEYVDDAVLNATKPKEGSVLLYPNDKPEALLVMDSTNISAAQTIWKFNKDGLSRSSDGYNGTYVKFYQNGKNVLNDDTVDSLDVASGTIESLDVTTITKKVNAVTMNVTYNLEQVVEVMGEDVTDSTGKCSVNLPNDIKAVMDGYQVFITKYGEGDMWISTKATTKFTVQSIEPNIEFGYLIKARIK